jgi:hypothetical protein
LIVALGYLRLVGESRPASRRYPTRSARGRSADASRWAAVAFSSFLLLQRRR